MGNRAYGVGAAAQVYYGKTLDELSLAEIATIAGLPKAPSRYNPLANHERAMVRRNWILGRMLSLGNIDEAQYEAAIKRWITPPTMAPYQNWMQLTPPKWCASR